MSVRDLRWGGEMAATDMHPYGSLPKKDNSAEKMNESGSQAVHVGSEADFPVVKLSPRWNIR